MFWAARFLLYSRRDFYLSSIPWFIKHWTPTSLRIPSLDPPLGEKPSALPPFLWITGASPFHSVSDGILCTRHLSTEHRHGFSVFSFRTVQQYWATLREPCMTRPASPALVWFWFWLLFPVFIGWLSVLLFFRVITATSNPKTPKRGSKSSPNFVFLIQRTGYPPQNWRGKSVSLISVCWTCA